MTLPDLLEDLAGSSSPPPPGLAGRAWSQGRRRRHRARAQAVVAVAASLALLALVAPGLPRELPVPQVARSSDAAGVDGHPERIGRQWWVRELPDRPGPLAALLQVEGLTGAWQAVDASGYRWRLPGEVVTDQVPVLSRDGRLLAHLENDNGPLVVRDLVSGERTVFSEVGGHFPRPAGTAPARYQQHAQSPGFWSPNGRHLLLLGVPEPEPQSLLLDVQAGTVELLPGLLGTAAGWAADDRIVWLHSGDDVPPGSSAAIRARTTDLRGQQVAETELPGTEGGVVSQWSGAVSGDGERVGVLLDPTSASGTSTLHRFFLEGGLPFADPVPVQAEQSCGMAWGTTSLFGPVLPARDSEHRFLAVEARAAAPESYTVLDPAVGGRCLVWAGDAVDGPARGPAQWLLGTDRSTLGWWWRELLLGGLVLLGLAAFGAQRLRRAQRARIAAPAPRAERAGPATDWYG